MFLFGSGLPKVCFVHLVYVVKYYGLTFKLVMKAQQGDNTAVLLNTCAPKWPLYCHYDDVSETAP